MKDSSGSTRARWRWCVLALAFGWFADPAGLEAVSTQQVVHRTAEDFGTGKLEQVMVSDQGVLTIAPRIEQVVQIDDPIIWDIAVEPSGDVILATGSEGRVYRLHRSTREVTLIGDFDEQQVTAVVTTAGGDLYAATSPGGKIYRYGAGGSGDTGWEVAAQVDATYVWDLEATSGGDIIVATGDPGGIFRASPGKDLEPLLETDELHILSLVMSGDDLYAGSANGGYVYHVRLNGRKKGVEVLLDAAGQEARRLSIGPGGVLWALTSGESDGLGDDDHELSGVLHLVADDTGDNGPVAETHLYRLVPGKAPEDIWQAKDTTGHSLGMLGDRAIVGIGEEGRIVAVGPDRRLFLFTDLSGKQVTAMAGEAGTLWVAVSNPASVYRVEEALADRGTYTSRVIDTGLYATWGRLEVLLQEPSGGKVEVQTRSGNTEKPDGTWSRWEAVHERIASPPARYLQYRLILAGRRGQGPQIREVDAYHCPANSRPVLEELRVLDPGIRLQQKEDFRSEPAPRGINEPAEPPPEPQVKKREDPRIQGVAWKASDPDGDDLAFDVALRPAGTRAWKVVVEDGRETFANFDASALPDGWYQVRVVAKDSPSNTPDQVLSDQRISAPFPVDHTPPALRTLSARTRGDPVEIEVEATDDTTYLRAARHALDGGTFQAMFPADSVFDSRKERFKITLHGIQEGDHVLVIAVEDGVGNVATINVHIP